MAHKAVVTGGCGFIGSHIVDLLLKQGWAVSVVDNLSTGSLHNIKDFEPYIDLIIGDIREESSLFGAFENAQVVFHQAAFISVPESELNCSECYDVNVGGTIKVAKIAEKSGVKKIIFASSCALYGDNKEIPLDENSSINPLSPYAHSKIVAEEILREFSLRTNVSVKILRYFNVYGPGQNPNGMYSAVISRFMNEGLRKKEICVEGSGQQTRDFVFVDDVARANLLAVEKSNESYGVYNICSAKETSINELAIEMSHIINGLKIEHISGRRNDILRSCGSYEKAKINLNYEPQVAIKEGLKITFEKMKERIANE